MNNLLNRTLIISAVAIAFSLPVKADVTDKIEKEFSVNANSNFKLENINGSVEIVSWQEPTIKVIAEISADNQTSFDRVEVKITQSGETVRVVTDYESDSNWKNNNNNNVQVTYKVWLPRDTNLSDIELVNGGLTIENISGEVNAELVNGSVKATGLSNDSNINTVNGSIKVYYQAQSDDLNKINIETVNGSIKLYLPSDFNARLNIETMHGSIKTDFGLQSEKDTFIGHSLEGDIGSGGTNISLETVNGSVKVKQK